MKVHITKSPSTFGKHHVMLSGDDVDDLRLLRQLIIGRGVEMGSVLLNRDGSKYQGQYRLGFFVLK